MSHSDVGEKERQLRLLKEARMMEARSKTNSDALKAKVSKIGKVTRTKVAKRGRSRG